MSEFFGQDLGVIHEMLVTGRKARVDASFFGALAHSEQGFKMIVPLARHFHAVEAHKLDISKMPSLEEVQSFCEWIKNAGCVHCISIDDYVYFGVITEKEKPKTPEEQVAFWTPERIHGRETDWVIRKRVAELGIHHQEMVAVSRHFYIAKTGDGVETFTWRHNGCLEGAVFAEAVSRILFQRKFFEQIATLKGVYEYRY